MVKYWYVVQMQNGDFYLGFCFARLEADETELLSSMNDFCQKKKYKLLPLIQAVQGLPIVNQVFPFESTEESRACIAMVLEAIKEDNKAAEISAPSGQNRKEHIIKLNTIKEREVLEQKKGQYLKEIHRLVGLIDDMHALKCIYTTANVFYKNTAH